jgi:hypothetical protein
LLLRLSYKASVSKRQQTRANVTYNSAATANSVIAVGERRLIDRVGPCGSAAALSSMQSHLIGGDLVDALDNIDFTAIGPVYSRCPDAGPYLASKGFDQPGALRGLCVD